MVWQLPKKILYLQLYVLSDDNRRSHHPACASHCPHSVMLQAVHCMSVLECVVPPKCLGPEHRWFTIHCLKHLWHFCHWFLQLLAKFDVRLLPNTIYFPILKLYTHLSLLWDLSHLSDLVEMRKLFTHVTLGRYFM